MSFGDGIDWDFEAQRSARDDQPVAHDAEVVQHMKRLCPEARLLLDAGCNIGNFCPLFTGAGYLYCGFDQSAIALNIARSRYPLPGGGVFIEGMLWDMPFEAADDPVGHAPSGWHGGGFDIVHVNAVLQHNRMEEKLRIMPRITAATRIGGLFVMAESTLPLETATQLTSEGWIALAERHGFALIETWHQNELGLDDTYAFRRVAE